MSASIRPPETTADHALDELWTRTAHTRPDLTTKGVRAQHERGKLTARERIALLLDAGTFTELDVLARSADGSAPSGDGVVTGYGEVDGRPVCVFAHDFTVLGGSLGETFGRKVAKVMDLAASIGAPIVGINDSGGARIQEGVVSLAYYAEIARRNVELSGVVPQISLILGPCAGGAVYSPALTDFVVMVERTSHMFVTGPEVVRAVTGEDVDRELLGGPVMNASVAGNAHHVAPTEPEAIAWVRDLLGFLPSNNLDPAVAYEAAEDLAPDLTLDALIPEDPTRGYDVLDAVRAVVDDHDLLEIAPDFARNIACGFARVDGRPVGVVANQPLHQGGVLDIDASEKAARFVRFCDAFNLPVLTFVDVPGYLPGLAQERAGIIRRGSKLFYAYCASSVPLVTVVLRKAYGGGYATMASKHLGADVNLAWPTAEIAVMGGSAAVSVLHRAELRAAAERDEFDRVRRELIARYRADYATPYRAAEHGYVDAVIRPSTTRRHVVLALRSLRTKSVSPPRRKHGNVPL